MQNFLKKNCQKEALLFLAVLIFLIKLLIKVCYKFCFATLTFDFGLKKFSKRMSNSSFANIKPTSRFQIYFSAPQTIKTKFYSFSS